MNDTERIIAKLDQLEARLAALDTKLHGHQEGVVRDLDQLKRALYHTRHFLDERLDQTGRTVVECILRSKLALAQKLQKAMLFLAHMLGRPLSLLVFSLVVYSVMYGMPF